MNKTVKVDLWHPESPGGRVRVTPGLWRRLGINRSKFATLSETIRMYRNLPDPYRKRR